MHCRIVQAMIVEILHQIGFEKANKQALQVLIDLAMECISQRLRHVKQLVETVEQEIQDRLDRLEVVEERQGVVIPGVDSAQDSAEAPGEKQRREARLLEAMIDECTGQPGCYKREELISFLAFQTNITKQLKKEAGTEASVLELLRVGDVPAGEEKHERGLVDFTGEEEGEKKLEEKKYLDQDVREYLQAHPALPLERPSETRSLAPAVADLDQPIVTVHPKKRELLVRENMRDYEYMLSRKRLTTKYWTPCETTAEIPLLNDLLILSTTRKIKKKRREELDKDKGKEEAVDPKATACEAAI